MQKTIDETNRRREKQLLYNKQHGITPQQIIKNTQSTLLKAEFKIEPATYIEKESYSIAADPVIQYMTKKDLEKLIVKTKKAMLEAAKKLEFLEAAQYQDELMKLEEKIKKDFVPAK